MHFACGGIKGDATNSHNYLKHSVVEFNLRLLRLNVGANLRLTPSKKRCR